MSETTETTMRQRGGWRDFWQLHVPLVVVLALCTFITIIEVRRASEGVWRAWAYMFEWPLIGLFTVWIWHRYRTEGSVTKGFISRWRERIERLGREADEADVADAPGRAPESDRLAAVPAQSQPEDAQLADWESYVADLHRREPPGEPPN